MATLYNPSLREELLSQRPGVIPPRKEESILAWLEATGRLISNGSEYAYRETEGEELAEILETSDTYEFAEEEEDLDLEE
jgi:hypothetical protein